MTSTFVTVEDEHDEYIVAVEDENEKYILNVLAEHIIDIAP